MKFLIYGVVVLLFSVIASWVNLASGPSSSGSRGSSWSSHTGGGSWGGGGGHK
ncbi:hypothetical protein ACFFTM_24860 [Pseudoduganella plicata]|uniref:Uncharacterized protein n=1 Tax=Pseudoduganella plicata TaxID=321984 RepID=A0AA87Y7F2_9BURK|nr:hypothetical protein [Pseudoduganella plicata]GGY90399.1 hypothetical protein GCM10007388_24580 [Pseudoduganella plicata]